MSEIAQCERLYGANGVRLLEISPKIPSNRCTSSVVGARESVFRFVFKRVPISPDAHGAGSPPRSHAQREHLPSTLDSSSESASVLLYALHGHTVIYIHVSRN